MPLEPFIGEISIFAGNFAPRGWAFCNGQLLPISQNTALFSLLGTTYGGDGRTTFALPDLRGRVPMHAGDGPGLQPRSLGEKGGKEEVNLTLTQMPSHSHPVSGTVRAYNGNPDSESPEETVLANGDFYSSQSPDVKMHTDSVQITLGNTGGSQPHTNVQPYQCVNYIIALEGVFPSRN
jgi:microcystin-dependent protein